MLLTDAVSNNVPLTLKDVAVNVQGNKLLFTDEFGTMVKIFTDDDPNLEQKVRFFWGDFLKRRTDKLRERMEANDTTERWYEIVFPAPINRTEVKTMEDVTIAIRSFAERDIQPIAVYYHTRTEIDPTDETE